MRIPEAPHIWLDGRLVPWQDATVHVMAHGLQYGTGIFEGTRVHATSRGPAAFRLEDHLRRFERSARMVQLPLEHSVDELLKASLELIRANGHDACYLRHTAFFGYGEIGMDTRNAPVTCAIAGWEMGSYLGGDADLHGITLGTSTWRRSDPNTVPTAAKATGPYLTSALAKREALAAGFDEALMLSRDGYVCECSAENIFVVRDGALIGPPASTGALSGITAASVRALAEHAGIPVLTENLLRSDVYTADEVFVTGTAAGVVPVRSVDHREIGEPGPVTRRLRELLDRVTAGEEPAFDSWLTYVH
ncbi:branched-chain amino acid transaminase [Streptomyces sp. NPDC038707]|uniref:branched-chain amino acid transaminase n=1 Tax=unclassified Streptomyces TaxID=2593676 RepID=UPI0033DE5688